MRYPYALVLLIALSCYPRISHADVPQWGAGDEVTTKILGSFASRSFTAERREQPWGSDLQALRVSILWTEADGEDREQVLVDGSVGDSLDLEDMELDGSVLSYSRQPLSRYAELGEHMVVKLRFSASAGRFVDKKTTVHKPYSDARHQLEDALRNDDLGMGRAILDTIGATPNGGNTNLEDEYFSLFLDTTHRLAMRHWRAGRGLQGAALIWSLLTHPPVDPGMASDASWSSKVLPRQRSFPSMAFVRPSPNRIAQINDLAFILQEGAPSIASDAHEKAIDLLREVVSHAPKRAAARLNLADGLWQLSVHEPSSKAAEFFRLEAKEHYAAYAKLVDGKRVPERVHARLAPLKTP